MKKNYRKNFNRREFLLNTAGGLASATALNAFTQRALAQETGFKRLIIWYVPEGCAQQAFWPADTGNLQINQQANINGKNVRSNGTSIRSYVDRSMAGYCLQPMQEHINDIALYSGFQNRGGSASDPHKKVVETALTGGRQADGSLDQIMGRELKGNSPLSSIYIPVYGHHILNRGAANDYLSPIRRIGGGVTGSANWNPMEVYNQVFPSGVPAPSGGSGPAPFGRNHTQLEILKSVESRIAEVQCLGGDEARRKMEVLLESFQKLEADTQAIVDAENDMSAGSPDVRFNIPNGWTNTQGSRTDRSKYWNNDANFGRLANIAIDTTVAALALDRTRVSCIQFSASGTDNGPVGHDHYKKVGINDLEGGDVNDHYLGHDPNPVRRRNQARIYRWYYGRLAYLLRRLKEIPDGNGTLFDSTLVVTASEFGMYNHRNNDIPYIVAGGSGFNIRKGWYGNVSSGNNFRHSADFFLGVTRALGTNLSRFGQSTNPFAL